jgi:two-component system, LuxR family, response regulator FixJ
MNATRPTVFLVDDDQGALDSLRFLVQSDGLRVESFSSARAFLERFDPEAAGCVVIDYRMPDMNGLDLQDELRNRGAILPVIVVTAHGDVASCARAFRAGAVDYLEKPLKGQLLLERLHAAILRDAQQREQLSGCTDLQRQLAMLTMREREVLGLLVEGRSLKQIALEFGVSIQTAAKHRAKVLEKLHVANDIELVRLVFGYDFSGKDTKVTPSLHSTPR